MRKKEVEKEGKEVEKELEKENDGGRRDMKGYR